MGGSGSNPPPDKGQSSFLPSLSDSPAKERRCHILIVEDNKADVFLIQRAIAAANVGAELHLVQDGEKAVRFFDQVDADNSLPCPALVIIDINLPKRHGGEVIDHMRKSRRCANALVLVVTSSDSARDREEMAMRGANAYFRKPSEYGNFMKLGEVVKSLLETRNLGNQ